ncbi:hypothetical protein EBU99_06425, partial [bacterium]|nr:hypothetical protein [bacterium]
MIAPGETVIFFPDANYNGNPAEIFRFLAYDGAAFSDLNPATPALDPVPVTVNIQPVNTPPTLNATAILDGSLAASRNTEYSITFDQLAQKLDLKDVENVNPSAAIPGRYDSVRLRFDQILGGSYLKNDFGLIDDTNNTLLQGQTLKWMPPNNATGTFEAFVVSVVDSDNAQSLTTGRVSITVNGSTQKPVIANATLTMPTNGKQNTGYSITHADLMALLNVTDADSNWISFVVTSISNGTIKKGSQDIIAFPSAPATPLPTAIIAPYETLTFLPGLNVNGLKEIFRVQAYDGLKYSDTNAVISLNLDRTNLVPLLTRVNDFTGGVEDTPFTFTYQNLRDKTDASDLEETVAGVTQLKFKIKSINTGLLKRTSGT